MPSINNNDRRISHSSQTSQTEGSTISQKSGSMGIRMVKRRAGEGILPIRRFSEGTTKPLQIQPAGPENSQVRILANIQGIGNTQESEEYEGLYPRHALAALNHTIDQFTHSPNRFSPKIQREIGEAFHAAASEEEVVKNFKAGKLTVIDAGFKGHSMKVVIDGDYLLVCNRGASLPPGGKTITAYKIDRKRLTPEILQRIIQARFTLEGRDAGDFYYRELPELLCEGGAVQKDEICEQLEKISPKAQTLGNCVVASYKTAARACYALRALKGNGGKPLTGKQIGEAVDYSKTFSAFARYTTDLKYTLNGGQDNYLIANSRKKIAKHYKYLSNAMIAYIQHKCVDRPTQQMA